MLKEYVESLGLGGKLASIRVLAANGAEIAAKPTEAAEDLYQAAQSAVEQDGAELILLAGAGMVGQVGPLQQRLGVTVMDGLTPAIRRVESAIDAGPSSTDRVYSKGEVATIGLHAELEGLLGGGKPAGPAQKLARHARVLEPEAHSSDH
jgi:hypothetical protein